MKMEAASVLIFLIFLVVLAHSARDVFMPSAIEAEEGNHHYIDDALILSELERLSKNEVPSSERFPLEFCDSCLEFSRRAEKILSDSTVFKEIDNLASIFCGFAPSYLKEECIDMVEKHKHEAIMLLQEIVIEESFCNNTGLCPENAQETSLSTSRKAEPSAASGELNEMLSMMQKALPMEVVERFLNSENSLKNNQILLELNSNKTCNACLSVLNKIRGELEDPDKQLNIITSLLKACEAEVFVYRCKRVIFSYGPLVITNIQRIVNMNLCHMVHICKDPKNETTHVIEKFGQHLPISVAQLDVM